MNDINGEKEIRFFICLREIKEKHTDFFSKQNERLTNYIIFRRGDEPNFVAQLTKRHDLPKEIWDEVQTCLQESSLLDHPESIQN